MGGNSMASLAAIKAQAFPPTPILLLGRESRARCTQGVDD